MSLIVLLAAAVAAVGGNATPYFDGRPPAQLQHDNVVTMEFAGQSRINDVCNAQFGAPPAGMQTQACATAGKRLIMPNPCAFPESETYARLLCHELGHANGWPPTHGGFPQAVEPVSNKAPSDRDAAGEADPAFRQRGASTQPGQSD